jgi:hypothetical protein
MSKVKNWRPPVLGLGACNPNQRNWWKRLVLSLGPDWRVVGEEFRLDLIKNLEHQGVLEWQDLGPIPGTGKNLKRKRIAVLTHLGLRWREFWEHKAVFRQRHLDVCRDYYEEQGRPVTLEELGGGLGHFWKRTPGYMRRLLERVGGWHECSDEGCPGGWRPPPLAEGK